MIHRSRRSYRGSNIMKPLALLLFLIPPAQALSIAASPDIVNLNPQGEAALRLFNPNEETVYYTLEGERFQKQEGMLEPSSYIDLHLVNRRFIGEGNLKVSYQSAKGSDRVELRPALQLRVIRNGISRESVFPFLLLAFLIFLCLGGVLVWIV